MWYLNRLMTKNQVLSFEKKFKNFFCDFLRTISPLLKRYNFLGTTEQTRREENLFSLKHFLKQDATSEQCNQMSGVRPKIPSNFSTTSEKIRIKRSPRFSSFDSQASLASSIPQQPVDVTGMGSDSHFLQSNRSFNNMHSSDADNQTQKNTPIQRSCSAYDQRPISFLDSDKNADMHLTDAFRDLYPNLMKNLNPDNPSALPDFVQDHLLMEKFYYKDDRSPIVSPLSSSYNAHQYDHHQLPDFTLNENDGGRNYSTNNGDMPFDLMCNSNESNRTATNRNPLILPLDLPISNNAGRSQMSSHQMHNNYQLDLTARADGYPPVNEHLSNSRNTHLSSGGGGGGGDSFQTLPDFLSDGHVHSTGRQPDLQELQETTSPESELANDFMPRTRSEMRSENNRYLRDAYETDEFLFLNRNYLFLCLCRLRRELKNRNQVISDQARRIAELESTLAAVRHNENATQNVSDVAGNRSDVSVT